MPLLTSASGVYFGTCALYNAIASLLAHIGSFGSINGVTLRTPLPLAPAAFISVFDVHVPDMYTSGFQLEAPSWLSAVGHARRVAPSTNTSASLAASVVICDVTSPVSVS